uniref:Uncharacterized protein n=1 Tax=Rhizophora mucronata TaxID=61149 RepID=A0A2P2JPS3_RHIMU
MSCLDFETSKLERNLMEQEVLDFRDG